MNSEKVVPRYAVLVPAGPNVQAEFLSDTIDSALYCLGKETLVVVGDDSGTNKFADMSKLGSNVFVREVPQVGSSARSHTLTGKLFLKKARLLRNIVAEFQFDRLLNLDDDALMLNNRVVDVAERLFNVRHKAGILGRYALNHEFQPVAYEAQLDQMRAQISKFPFKNPKYVSPWRQASVRRTMRPLMLEAAGNGYTMGTSYIGGSCIMTRDCLDAILARPEIDDDIFIHSPSGEDDLFTIFCYACGYRVYDLLHEPAIFHIGWRKLTMSPVSLVQLGASVIHSVRDPEFGGEARIREFFRERRERGL